MTKVLIVDDSALMRNIIKDIVSDIDGFEVIGLAKNGAEAVEMVKTLSPDIVTMDIEMPVMDGIESVRAIMKDNPTKIVILSAFGAVDAMPTLNALKCGAVDVIQKPSGVISPNLRSIKHKIVSKLQEIALIPIEKIQRLNREHIRKVEASKAGIMGKCIVIAASTGGPKALEKLVPSIPSELGAYIFLVQHMPQTFTKSFSERLNRISEIEVKEVEAEEPLLPNKIYLGKGNNHFKIDVKDKRLFSSLTKEPPLWGVRPAADYLFDSAAQLFIKNTLGIVLTGMGRDGTLGCKVIKDFGGMVAAQSRASAFIWGMPGAVIQEGYADYEADLSGMPDIIEKFMRK